MSEREEREVYERMVEAERFADRAERALQGADRERDGLLAALPSPPAPPPDAIEHVLVAGNHLANALISLAGTAYPPFTAGVDEGREWFHANVKSHWVVAYDVWIGWRAAMRLSRALPSATTPPHALLLSDSKLPIHQLLDEMRDAAAPRPAPAIRLPAERALQDFRVEMLADATGHLHRCAKVQGTWTCAPGCAVARAEQAERERDAQKQAADHWFTEANRDHNDLVRAESALAEARGALARFKAWADKWAADAGSAAEFRATDQYREMTAILRAPGQEADQ